MVLKFQVLSVCFLCSPPDVNSSKFNPLCYKGHQFSEYKFRYPPCLKPLLANLTSSLSYCRYQKDERAKHGNFVTKLCPPPNIKRLFCNIFPFSLTSLLYRVTAVPLHASKHPAKWLNEDWHHWFFTETRSNIIIILNNTR
jgi:hypothetical protein